MAKAKPTEAATKAADTFSKAAASFNAKAKPKAPAKKKPAAKKPATAAPKTLKVNQDSPVAKVQPKTATGSGGSGGGSGPKRVGTSSPGPKALPGPAKKGTAVGPARSPRVEKDMGKASRVDAPKLSGPKAAAKPSLGSRVLGALGKAGRAAGWAGLAISAAPVVNDVLKKATDKKAHGNVKARGLTDSRMDAARTAPKAADAGHRSTATAAKSKPAETRKAEPSKPAAKAPAKKAAAKSGGKYPVYPKASAQAADFRKHFAAARKAGKSEFTWEGRKYNTKLKGK